jgi:flagellin
VPNGGSRSVVVDVTASAETAQLVYGGGALASSTSIQVAGQYGTEQLSFAAGATVNDIATAVNGSTTLTGVSATASGGNVYFNSTDYGSDAFVTVEALAGSFSVTGGDTAVTDYGVDVGVNVNGVQAVSDGLDISVRTNAFSADMTLTSSFATDTSSVKTFYVTGGGADFSIAPTVGINSLASLGIPDVSTGSLGKASVGFLQSIGTGGANEMDSGNFETAQRIVREASKQVSTLRGRLGAFQKDTLSTMINSLEVAMENTTAAESAIRDADFAKETSSLTRAQILVNSSMSTLQLANAAPRNVLSLIG